jgi:hypothetical protein
MSFVMRNQHAWAVNCHTYDSVRPSSGNSSYTKITVSTVLGKCEGQFAYVSTVLGKCEGQFAYAAQTNEVV